MLQDNNELFLGHAIARGVAHKNRFFGQSHWMNGFVVFRDIIDMLQPTLADNMTSLMVKLNRAKVLARMIKSRRSPPWPPMTSSELPSRELCDVLVTNYLNTFECLYRVLHVPTFKKEYASIWNRDTAVTPALMTQVKLVLALGAVFYDQNFSLRTSAMQWIYEAQIYISAPSFKSKLGLTYLQTNILLLLAREFVDIGSDYVWIAAGSLLRELIYMGLHKDPAVLPGSSMLQAEMRRRLWNTVLEINLQSSLFSGTPCMFSMEDFSTRPPGNFDDGDLVPEAESLTPKPDEILTDSSLIIALRQTLPTRIKIIKVLNGVHANGTFEETLQIDKELRASYKILRRRLQDYRMGHEAGKSFFAVDAMGFIMNRYISSLHIPFFTPSLSEAVYAYSRRAVVDSSLRIWSLACPDPALLQRQLGTDLASETHLARLCRCGGRSTRAYAFHAIAFLAAEYRALLRDDDMLPRPELCNVVEHASTFLIRAIEAGETGVRGNLLLAILEAQFEGIRKRVPDREMPSMLVRRSEEAIDRCMVLLEQQAGMEQESDGATASTGAFEFDISPDFTDGWSLGMFGAFDFNSGPSFDAFIASC